MKKLFIAILILVTPAVFCQFEKSDTLFKSTGAKDTTVFRVFKNDMAYLELDISTLADNDTVDILMSADKTWGASLAVASPLFPVKITKSTYRKNVNGTVKYRIAITGKFSAKYIGFRIKCAGAAKPNIHY
jgi:hypothetical protein